jgi:hypothetical protein
MHIDTINVKNILIFELEEYFELYIIEYILFNHVETYVNFERRRIKLRSTKRKISTTT